MITSCLLLSPQTLSPWSLSPLLDDLLWHFLFCWENLFKKKSPLFSSPKLSTCPSLSRLFYSIQCWGWNVCILESEGVRKRCISCYSVCKMPHILLVFNVILIHSYFCVCFSQVNCSSGSTSLSNKLPSSAWLEMKHHCYRKKWSSNCFSALPTSILGDI